MKVKQFTIPNEELDDFHEWHHFTVHNHENHMAKKPFAGFKTHCPKCINSGQVVENADHVKWFSCPWCGNSGSWHKIAGDLRDLIRWEKTHTDTFDENVHEMSQHCPYDNDKLYQPEDCIAQDCNLCWKHDQPIKADLN